MAQHFLSSIYGDGTGRPVGTAQGVTYSFPVEGTVFRDAGVANAYNTFNGVIALSIIEVLPTGLQVKSKSYYSIDSVTTLNTRSNA